MVFETKLYICERSWRYLSILILQILTDIAKKDQSPRRNKDVSDYCGDRSHRSRCLPFSESQYFPFFRCASPWRKTRRSSMLQARSDKSQLYAVSSHVVTRPAVAGSWRSSSACKTNFLDRLRFTVPPPAF